MVDVAMNVDVTGSTIDSERLLEDARKLGIDFEDLQEFGFDVYNNNCGGSGCMKPKTYKEFLVKYEIFK